MPGRMRIQQNDADPVGIRIHNTAIDKYFFTKKLLLSSLNMGLRSLDKNLARIQIRGSETPDLGSETLSRGSTECLKFRTVS